MTSQHSSVARSAYPTGHAARRALATLREEGLRSFWFKLLARCGYRRLLLLERSLDTPVPELVPRLPVDIALLTEDEADEYRAFRPEMLRRDAIERLRSGQRCFVARRDGRIVAGVWSAFEPLWLSFLGAEIGMAPGDAHIYDKFVLPAYRGQEISNALRMHCLRHLQRSGYRRAIVAVLPENASSLRDIVKGGYRPYGIVARIRIGSWQRVFMMRPRRGRI